MNEISGWTQHHQKERRIHPNPHEGLLISFKSDQSDHSQEHHHHNICEGRLVLLDLERAGCKAHTSHTCSLSLVSGMTVRDLCHVIGILFDFTFFSNMDSNTQPWWEPLSQSLLGLKMTFIIPWHVTWKPSLFWGFHCSLLQSAHKT